MANIRDLRSITAAEAFGGHATAIVQARPVVAFAALSGRLIMSTAIPVVAVYMNAINPGFR